MATTIQVDEKTLKTLAVLKQELKASSYQEVIERLIADRRKVPDSLYGYAKGSRHYAHASDLPRSGIR